MIEMTLLQFIGCCFISGFVGAASNDILNKLEEVYDKCKKNKNESESTKCNS